jgi:hypothetical protein
MVTSLPGSVDEHVQLAAQLLEGGDPQRKNCLALGCQGVGALRGTGQVTAPLGRDEPFVLQRTQLPIDVSDVDAFLTDEPGQTLEELVAMGRAVREEDEETRLAEALDARPHLPGAVVSLTAIPRSRAAVAMHADSICNLHM